MIDGRGVPQLPILYHPTNGVFSARTTALVLVLVFFGACHFIDPIGASEVDPGCTTANAGLALTGVPASGGSCA